MIDKFEIPIDEKRKQFLDHLNANPRTILSSKFGDGKSYFLDKIRADEEACEKFEFLTIYPVNYQVTSNKDIFEFIKRDILFQLFIHDMLSEEIEISEDVAFAYYIKNNGISLFQDLISFFSEVELNSEECNKILLGLKGLKVFQNLHDSFKRFKIQLSKTNCIERLIDSVDENYLYEDDIVTNLVRTTIEDYKQRTGKDVVLFLEDLDRIDPAHLFRILNVFSAHMDYCYKNAVKPDNSLIGNKFSLDHVVLVIDYRNMKKIFHHFYGAETDFSGYISKFSCSTPFYYSLREERKKYISQELIRITGSPQNLLDILIPFDMIDELTMREVVNSFKIDKQIIRKPIYRQGGKKINLPDCLLKVLAVMRRMRVSEEEINQAVSKLYREDKNLFYQLAAPYLYLYNDNNKFGLDLDVSLPNDRGKYQRRTLQLDPVKGTCSVDTTYMNIDQEGANLEQLCIDMQKYIAR